MAQKTLYGAKHVVSGASEQKKLAFFNNGLSLNIGGRSPKGLRLYRRQDRCSGRSGRVLTGIQFTSSLHMYENHSDWYKGIQATGDQAGPDGEGASPRSSNRSERLWK